MVAWSWPSRALRDRFEADTRQVYAVGPDSRTVASIGNDGKVRFLDLRTGKPLSGFLEGHGEPTTSAAFSPDGSILATAGSDGSPILWGRPNPEATRGSAARAVTGDEDAVALTDDGRRLIAQYFDGQTWVWDVDHLPGGTAPAPSAAGT